LFAQEYDSLKELFNQCGFEATDGFLEHVQQQKSMNGDPSSSPPPSAPFDTKSRLQSITIPKTTNTPRKKKISANIAYIQ
jgi:hypothetical protein